MENKLSFIVSQVHNNCDARTFLRKECGVSARIITCLKREKDGILRNEKPLRTVDKIFTGDVIEINLPKDKNEIKPVKGNLDIVYEDDYILALNKPYGITVHPTKNYQLDTLANRVVYYAYQRNEHYTFRAVSRLDKDTSGIVIIAKNSYCATLLSKGVSKVYYALCQGKVSCDGTINSPIGMAQNSSVKRAVAKGGAAAITHYKVLQYSEGNTLLRVTLETGRTHQIRCHMSSIGFPLVGDDLYGGSKNLINRQALHCGEVSFTHPITKKIINLNTDIPKDIMSLL